MNTAAPSNRTVPDRLLLLWLLESGKQLSLSGVGSHVRILIEEDADGMRSRATLDEPDAARRKALAGMETSLCNLGRDLLSWRDPRVLRDDEIRRTVFTLTHSGAVHIDSETRTPISRGASRGWVDLSPLRKEALSREDVAAACLRAVLPEKEDPFPVSVLMRAAARLDGGSEAGCAAAAEEILGAAGHAGRDALAIDIHARLHPELDARRQGEPGPFLDLPEISGPVALHLDPEEAYALLRQGAHHAADPALKHLAARIRGQLARDAPDADPLHPLRDDGDGPGLS